MLFRLNTGSLIVTTAVIAGVLTVGGCGQKSSESASPAVAHVGGSVITEAELNHTVLSNFGPRAVAEIDEAGKRTVLDGLILSRAIASEYEPKLTQEQKDNIAVATDLYREKLITQYRIEQELKDSPITKDAVEAYYNEHLHLFGQQRVHHYELLKGNFHKEADKKAETLALLKQGQKAEDLKAYSRNDDVKNIGIVYISGTLKPGVFAPRLEQMVKSVKQGETTNTFFIQGVPYVARKKAIEKTAAKPLNQVYGQAKKALTAERYKKVISDIKDNVLSNTNVEYVKVKAK